MRFHPTPLFQPNELDPLTSLVFQEPRSIVDVNGRQEEPNQMHASQAQVDPYNSGLPGLPKLPGLTRS